MESRRDVFQAIADPTRRAIILLLAVGTMTPNSIAAHFKSSRQAVSKHLQILTECEILFQTQNGREIHYQLNAEKIKDVEQWLEQFKKLISRKFEQLDDVLNELKTLKK